MKKQKKPSVSQYSYMVTGLLSACVQRNGCVTETDVKMAIEMARVAYQMISELVADQDDEKPIAGTKQGNTLPVDHFADYPWDGQTATYTQLANWLKDKKGITLRQYIIAYRLKLACSMLRSTAKSINEIAEECGFTDASYFTKTFKAAYGETPKAYRNRFENDYM